MSDDKDVLARTMYGEAEPKDEADAVAIAWVVRNRVELPNWPNDYAGVCKQRTNGGVYQFSCWSPKHGFPDRLNKVTTADPWFRKCLEIAGKVMAGQIPDPTTRSTHYFADYIAWPKWAKGHTPVYSTPWGKYNHLFFNDIDTPPPPPPAPKKTVLETAVAVAPALGAALSGLSPWVVLILVAAGLAVGWFLWSRRSRA